MKPTINSYSGSFTLESGKSVLLDSGITELNSITEYSITNCNDESKNFHITASNLDGLKSLPCSDSDCVLSDLLIENKSGQIRSIEVKIVGLAGPQMEVAGK